MAKKTWAEKWGESEVNYWRPAEQLRKELKKVRNLTARRMKSLENSKFYSYAVHSTEQALERIYIHGKQPKVENMSQQQLERELRIMHQFWASKTSTKSGAKEEILSQSRRIFGTNKRGKPTRILSRDEANKVWTLFDEFYNQVGGRALYDSFRLQRLIGEQILSGYDESSLDIARRIEELKNQMDEEQETAALFEFQQNKAALDIGEVFHGGPDFKL